MVGEKQNEGGEAKMEFKTPEDRDLIIATSAFSSSKIHGCIELVLEKEGYSFEKKGEAWDEVYEITHRDKPDMKTEFHLYNLYFEIATVDRDIKPLEWDRRLIDLSFLQKKMANVIFSKIRPLLTILSSDDQKEMDEKLTKLAKDEKYDRFRMWTRKIKNDEGGE